MNLIILIKKKKNNHILPLGTVEKFVDYNKKKKYINVI